MGVCECAYIGRVSSSVEGECGVSASGPAETLATHPSVSHHPTCAARFGASFELVAELLPMLQQDSWGKLLFVKSTSSAPVSAVQQRVKAIFRGRSLTEKKWLEFLWAAAQIMAIEVASVDVLIEK